MEVDKGKKENWKKWSLSLNGSWNKKISMSLKFYLITVVNDIKVGQIEIIKKCKCDKFIKFQNWNDE